VADPRNGPVTVTTRPRPTERLRAIAALHQPARTGRAPRRCTECGNPHPCATYTATGAGGEPT
jgi:hypothetical protein